MSYNNERGGSLMTPRLIVGLAIALFGVVLVFDRLGLAMADQVLRFWPAVIIAVGALIFSKSRNVGGGVNGVIVMVIGAWLLMNTLGIVRVRFWELFWPMVLIAIGTVLVTQTLRRRTRDAAGIDAENTVTIYAVLSGAKHASAAPRFRGGEITLFMGGGQVDLRQATIPRGEEAVIDVFAVMGGCEIIVPPAWEVATPLVPVMGSVEDKRLAPLVVTGAEGSLGAGAPPRLVLRGMVMMGGIVIKS
jgi:predicted membrane protein